MNLHQMLLQREAEQRPIRVGVIGAGKFASMFLAQARLTPGIQVVGLADLSTERAKAALLRTGWEESGLSLESGSAGINTAAKKGRLAVTDDARAVIQAEADIILEITGVPEAGAEHAWLAFEEQKDVVLVNVEADCLVGPALKKKADQEGRIMSMAYGDQPALIAEQVDWARAVGMEVVCAGKGTRYQPSYHYSTPETVWGYYGFTEEQVAGGDFNPQMFNSFLDGTKSAVEMCALSNATGLKPQAEGLLFPPVGTDRLAEVLKPVQDGGILTESGTVEVVASEDRDEIPVQGDLRWGVYVVFKAPTEYARRCFREYGLATDSSGRYAALYRPSHLIGLELGISVASVGLRREPTGSTRSFLSDVAAAAKRDLRPGEELDGEGGYTVYGRLMQARDSVSKGCLPMGLTNGARVQKAVSRDQVLTFDDVELDETGLACRLRRDMVRSLADQR